MKKTRKAVLIFITIIVFIRILYICIGGEVDKNYYKSYSIDMTNAVEYPCINLSEKFISDGKRLHGIEITFTGIADDKSGHITLQLISENVLLYQTNIALTNINNRESKFIYVNADLDSGKEYEIHLTASDNCVQIPNVLVTAKENTSPEILESYSGENLIEGEIAIEFGYLQMPTIFERLFISSIWILLLLTAYIILFNFDKILKCINAIINIICEKVKPDILIIIVEILGCQIILDCSGIDFQNSTKIWFYIISFCATVKIVERREYVHKITNTALKKVFLYLLYIYAAFSLVGQRILIYPLTLKIQLSGIFVLINLLCYFKA